MKPINLYDLIAAALEQDDSRLTSGEKKLLHKQPNGVVDFIQKALNEEIEKRTAEEVESTFRSPKSPDFNVVPGPHASELFLSEEKLREAEAMFDQCGKIEIVIRKSESALKVHISKLVSDIKLASLEDERRAELGESIPDPGFQFDTPIGAGGSPLPPPGKEIILPPPPQGSTRPPPKPVDPAPSQRAIFPKKEDTNPVHLQRIPEKIAKPNGLPVFIGLPTQGQFHWAVNYSIFGQLKRCQGHLKITNRIDIRQARNVIVDSFQKSDAEWLYMQDSDIIAPFGNAGLYRELVGNRAMAFMPDAMGMVASEVITQSGKSFVGGIYSSRNSKREIVCNLGMKPKDEKDTAAIEEVRKKGPKAGLLQVLWMGFGCVAIHRQVFSDILKTTPELAKPNGEPVDFFDFTGGGEDVTFCQRAIKAGHPPYLNTAVWCAHLGQHAYLP